MLMPPGRHQAPDHLPDIWAATGTGVRQIMHDNCSYAVQTEGQDLQGGKRKRPKRAGADRIIPAAALRAIPLGPRMKTVQSRSNTRLMHLMVRVGVSVPTYNSVPHGRPLDKQDMWFKQSEK